jgi:transglutaminase-like putative cysteine protease
MRLLFRFSCAVFCSVVAIFFTTSSVFANENFSIDLNTTYQVLDNGQTQVNQQFAITNKTPKVYVTEYAIVVGSNQVTQVQALQGEAKLETNTVTTNNQTSISVTFADTLVGEGKTRTFNISYRTPDLAIISGQALEVSIPKLSSRDDFSRYTVTVLTPQRFGPPSRSYPTYSNWIPEKQNIKTTFTGLTDQSVMLLFGKEQYYHLTLRYNLENPTGSTGIIQVALPPDTAHQKLNYIDLNPSPQNIELDQDGNWIATYKIEAERQMTVYATLEARVTLDAASTVPQTPPTKNALSAQEFWPSNHNKAVEITQNLLSPKDIYDYVIQTLNYNYQKVGENNQRLGALVALEQPDNATCLEFTDLFITLARAKNIPARRMTGYAYTQNNTLRPLGLVEDILHAWPEYYDEAQRNWIPVDPTWEDTTGGSNYFDQFDLNHLVFAINSSSSTTPYAAGTYKLPQQQTKDVEVSFTKTFSVPEPDFSVEVKPLGFLPIPISGHYLVTLTNTTGAAHYTIPIKAETARGTDLKLESNQIESILPYQTVTIPMTLLSQNWTQLGTKDVKITINGQNYNFSLTSGTRFTFFLGYPSFWVGLGICIIGGTLLTGSVLVLRRPKKRAIRRKSEKS